VSLYERPGIVEQEFSGDAAEVPEGPIEARHPSRLPLVSEDRRVAPSAVPQRGDEQVHPSRHAPDLHHAAAEVDLELLTGRRLEADGRLGLGLQLLAVGLHRALDRPE
jgi:hypothetical protein